MLHWSKTVLYLFELQAVAQSSMFEKKIKSRLLKQCALFYRSLKYIFNFMYLVCLLLHEVAQLDFKTCSTNSLCLNVDIACFW